VNGEHVDAITTVMKVGYAHFAFDGKPHRYSQVDGRIVFASIIKNARFNSTNLFIQLLDPDQAETKSHHERRCELEARLFASGEIRKPSLEGCLSTIKTKVPATNSLALAEAEFWTRYTDKFANTSISSDDGKEYVHLRLSQWFSEH
jgi:hypothetical protein